MTDVMLKTPVATKARGEPLPVRRRSMFRNVMRYVLTRIAVLALTVTTAVYLTILIANYGGYVDTIIATNIREGVGMMMAGDWLRELPPAERMERAEETIAALQDAAGLNEPFLLRTTRWLANGLTLDWGGPERYRAYSTYSPGKTVGGVIADHLARTLLVFGLANLLLFVVAVFLALYLIRRHGGLLDRVLVLLSPISSAPAWVYGVILTTLFLRLFGFSPGGTFDSFSGGLALNQIRVILRHLTLPFLAIFLAGLFQAVFTWRSFFQVYRNEEYVEMARAKGLSTGRIDRSYIVRPALPALLTRFALLLAVLWQEVIALEYFFNVEGIGRLFVDALEAFDTPMIVATVTTFAYLLAITVFVLDLSYVLVDPRVRVGNQNQHDNRRTSGSRLAIMKGRRFRILSRARAVGASIVRQLRFSLPRLRLRALVGTSKHLFRQIGQTIRALREYPSAIVGLVIIIGLMGVSIYTVIAIPYSEAISLWRGDGRVWDRNPRGALPIWVNYFRRADLPRTLSYDSTDRNSGKQIMQLEGDLTDAIMPFTFDYPYDGYPQEIVVDLAADYDQRGPHVSMTWIRPDGSEQELTGFRPTSNDTYYVGRDERLKRRLDSDKPLEALFHSPDGQETEAVRGRYTLRINALQFEPDTNVDAKVTIIGQVYGLAGTDFQRRDLMIALLWGTPVALAFGLIAAFATSFGGMLFAALGAWYGGPIDRSVQFLTEVNLILPFFPVSLMVFIMYSKSIVTILAVTVALTLFGSAVKSYRATFLQVRTAPYIEAARAYGASDWRIVTRYMIPRIVTFLVPRLIILVPSYVFLEATLAFLGVTDPLLPTWGKLVVAALSHGVQTGAVHIVLAPLGVLFLTGFAFAMVGLALEKVFEPRMRDQRYRARKKNWREWGNLGLSVLIILALVDLALIVYFVLNPPF